MSDKIKELEEVSRALDLLYFLGKLDKKDSDLLVEFFEIKSEKAKSIKRAQEARKETQKTILNYLEVKEKQGGK